MTFKQVRLFAIVHFAWRNTLQHIAAGYKCAFRIHVFQAMVACFSQHSTIAYIGMNYF